MSKNTKRLDYPRRAFVGKYVFDSLSFGMYDHPLMALREYVQNSTDAIDGLDGGRSRNSIRQALIEITVDGRNRALTIKDNGVGVSAQMAWNVLHDLGRSEKDHQKSRGFRGIGRLGGLGYCAELRFTTKAAGEHFVSSTSWDCERLRQLISDNNNLFDVPSIVDQITTAKQETYHGKNSDHFFIVEMFDVRSSRDVLLDVPAIKAYLSQVAPVPFNNKVFRFGQKIGQELRKRIPTYETYCIYVNGEKIYKPYTNNIKTGDSCEEIRKVRFFELSNSNGQIAFGWLCDLGLVGRVAPSSYIDGLRVRSGNMQIGNKDIFAELYREKRFSGYMVGEVHVVDSRLVPNSRRDDFEDGPQRDDLHTCFIKEIGIPFSKKIRELSNERSKERKLGDINILRERINRVIHHGYIAELQKQDMEMHLSELNGGKQITPKKDAIEDVIQRITASKHILDNGHILRFNNQSDLLKSVFETIYEGMNNKIEAEKLIDKILEEIEISSDN